MNNTSIWIKDQTNPNRSILTLLEHLETVLNKNFKMLIQGIKWAASINCYWRNNSVRSWNCLSFPPLVLKRQAVQLGINSSIRLYNSILHNILLLGHLWKCSRSYCNHNVLPPGNNVRWWCCDKVHNQAKVSNKEQETLHGICSQYNTGICSYGIAWTLWIQIANTTFKPEEIGTSTSFFSSSMMIMSALMRWEGGRCCNNNMGQIYWFLTIEKFVKLWSY